MFIKYVNTILVHPSERFISESKKSQRDEIIHNVRNEGQETLQY
jgi:hypothetical protein